MLNTSMKTTKTYVCLTCGEEAKWTHQKSNKYCSTICSATGRFQTHTMPRFYAGALTERATIRKALIHTRGNECEVCHITEWNGKPIVFQVDHINGRADNDMPENLRLICANCHSQTPHFGGANKGQGRTALGLKTR